MCAVLYMDFTNIMCTDAHSRETTWHNSKYLNVHTGSRALLWVWHCAFVFHSLTSIMEEKKKKIATVSNFFPNEKSGRLPTLPPHLSTVKQAQLLTQCKRNYTVCTPEIFRSHNKWTSFLCFNCSKNVDISIFPLGFLETSYHKGSLVDS